VDCHNGRDTSVKLAVYCIIGSSERLNSCNACGSGSEATPAYFWKLSCFTDWPFSNFFLFLPGEFRIHTGRTFNWQWVGEKLHRTSSSYSSFYGFDRLASSHSELLWNCESYVHLDRRSALPKAAIYTGQQTQKRLNKHTSMPRVGEGISWFGPRDRIAYSLFCTSLIHAVSSRTTSVDY
jgi:hypothetical protein